MGTMPKILAFWRVPYSVNTARRLGYAVLAPVLAVVGLLLTVVGQANTAARYQRRLAAALVGSPAGEPLNRPRERKVVIASAIMLAVGLACWLLLWQFTYAILAVPLTVNFLALALAGRAPAASRFTRRLASRLAGGAPRWMGARVAGLSVAIALVGLVCWSLVAYLAVFAVGGLAFPFLDYSGKVPSYGGPPLPWSLLSHVRLSYHDTMWASTYHHSNGGPTAAGAWAYHAAQFLVTFFPLIVWMIRGLTRLQAWLTQAMPGQPLTSPKTGQQPATPRMVSPKSPGSDVTAKSSRPRARAPRLGAPAAFGFGAPARAAHRHERTRRHPPSTDLR
jgi:hypothetical protein